jgi:hypothetical protein
MVCIAEAAIGAGAKGSCLLDRAKFPDFFPVNGRRMIRSGLRPRASFRVVS